MSSLEKPILSWFKKNKRDLPWRDTTPWGVMVSEYMLQQTPVNRVLPKWNEWMERWPTPKDLAEATPAQVKKTKTVVVAIVMCLFASFVNILNLC